MSWQGLVQVMVIALLLAVTVPPLGRYLHAVFGGGPVRGDRVFRPVERAIYRACGIDETREQRWSTYALSLLAFSMMGVVALYVLLRVQGSLPLNPTHRGALPPRGAFNTAISFVTNTNWQWYSGEVTVSHLSQMIGLTVQNVVSAASGIVVAVALVRGITRAGAATIGNFWVDLVRVVLRVLLPMCLIFSLALVAQGAAQNLHGDRAAATVDRSTGVETQQIPGGPVASQEAPKMIGTNGGGFYNANSAHPFENPTPLTNILQIWALLVIPFGLVSMFGRMCRDRRQGRLLIAVMAGLLVTFGAIATFAEQTGNPRLAVTGVDQSMSVTQSGGNMEGKEIRFGTAGCGAFSAATTGTSTGAVNCAHDSLTPLGGLAPMAHMMLGEVSPGGVGTGLMGMLIYALLAVFIAGLMVGRTPEYLGKKIQGAEMKLLTLYILAMPFALLVFAAITVLLKSARTYQEGPHGLSEVLYNFASTANNNGSAFAWQATGSNWYTITQGVSMLIGRFFTIIPALAIGGALAAKPKVPTTAGTMPTHTALFGGLLVGVILIVAGLTFFPALALGPILEHLSL